jgi:tRNA A-37 threonylcarbamoyl transferase component Bud32
MGVRVLLDPRLAPALNAAGLASAPNLFRLGGDPDERRCVTAVDLPVQGTVGRFHVKRYRYDGWGASKGLLGRGTLWGTAPEVAEFKALQGLREHGISAVRPVAAASEARGGRLVAHALVTEHVPGAVDLAKRLATPGDPVREDRAVRRRTAELLGRLLHRMHAEGFVHRDCFARNVLVRVDEDDVRLWLCDCRRGGPPSWRSGTWHDVAALDGDLRGRMPRTDRLRALAAYLDEGADPSAAVRKIASLREKVRRAR